LEDAEAGDLARESFRLGRSVVACDAEQDADAGADLASRRHPGTCDALDDRLHGGIFSAVEVPDPRRVLLRARTQRARQLVVAVGLRRMSLLLETAAEGVVRVVVRGRELEHRAELGGGFVVPADAKVGDPERLADRRLVRLAPLRLL